MPVMLGGKKAPPRVRGDEIVRPGMGYKMRIYRPKLGETSMERYYRSKESYSRWKRWYQERGYSVRGRAI